MKGGEEGVMALKKNSGKGRFSEQNISMILGALVVIVMGVLLVNYFRGVQRTGTVTNPPQTAQTQEANGKTTLAADGKTKIHKVAKGETLWKIAEEYYQSGYNWVDIARENNLGQGNFLEVDQEIRIPRVEAKKITVKLAANENSAGNSVDEQKQAITGENYTVVKGDSLWNIAVRAYQDGYRWTEIAKENKLDNPGIIHPGNTLKLPR